MAVLGPCTAWRARGRRPPRSLVRLLLGVLLVVLAGCAPAANPPDASPPTGPTLPTLSSEPDDEGGGIPPTASPGRTRTSRPPLAEPEGTGPAPASSSTAPNLDSFLADCERGVREWRAAQVDHPAEFSVEVGERITYVAAVDARDTPVPPGEVIPGPSATGDAVAVRCEVAARLSPSGDELTVDETDWVLRRFTPTGFIRWSWTVTAAEGGDHELELELQPAIRTDDGRIEVGNSTLDVSTFITRAHVEEDAIQQAGSWMDSHKGPLAVIAAALAATVIGVLRFGREFATEMRQTVAAWSGARPGPGGTVSSADDENPASSADDPD